MSVFTRPISLTLIFPSLALAGGFPLHSFFKSKSRSLLQSSRPMCPASKILYPQASYMQMFKFQPFIFYQNLLLFPYFLSQSMPQHPTESGSILSTLASDQLPSPSLPLCFPRHGSGLAISHLLQRAPICVSDSSLFCDPF